MTDKLKDIEKTDKVRKAFEFSKDEFSDAISESEQAMRYLNNIQWSDKAKAQAQEHGKPALKYNLIVPVISALQGNEQLSRRRARIKPGDPQQDADLIDILQGRWNRLNDEQDIEEKLQSAFIDALTCPIGGWIERNFEINDRGYLDYVYRLANNFRVHLDPETRVNDYMLQSCRWMVKESWEDLEVIKDKFEIEYSLAEDEKKRWWTQLYDIIKKIKENAYSSESEGYDKQNDRYQILEMQERVTRKVFRCTDGNTFLSLTPQEYKKYKDKIPGLEKLYTDYDQRIHTTTTIPYFEDMIVVDEDNPIPTSNFDMFPVFSYHWNVQINESTSLVQLLIDIQDDVNKAKSQARDYITQILSGAMFFSKRDKDVVEKLRKNGNQPNQYYTLHNLQKPPHRQAPGTIPPDVLNNAENSVQFANRVSMVNRAVKGESGKSGESGRLFRLKAQQAGAAINPYFKNLSNLRKALAKDFVDNFPYVYSEADRIVELKKEDQVSQSIINLAIHGKTLNDTANLSASVELDEGEDSLSVQETNFEKMLSLTNIISQINPNFVDLKSLIKTAPVPNKDKWLEYINRVLDAQSQENQNQAQLEQTKQQLENQKTASEIEKNKQEVQTDQNEINIDQQELNLDQQKLNLEKQKMQQEPPPTLEKQNK